MISVILKVDLMRIRFTGAWYAAVIKNGVSKAKPLANVFMAEGFYSYFKQIALLRETTVTQNHEMGEGSWSIHHLWSS